MKIFLERKVKVGESKRIYGLALTPQISRNGTLYTVGQLEHADGVAVPLNIEHNGHALFGDKVVGEALFSYDPELEQLNYTATITDEGAYEWAASRMLHVSIEAEGTGSERVCNTGNDCFDMPRGLRFTALALTETPGIPQSTVSFLESTRSGDTTYIPLTITGGMATKSVKAPKGTVYVESVDGFIKLGNLKSFLENFGTHLKDAERKRLEALLENAPEANMDTGDVSDTTSTCGEGMVKDVDGNCVQADNKTVSAEAKSKEGDDDDDKDEDDDSDDDADKKEKKKESKRKEKKSKEQDDDDDKDDMEESTGHGMPNMDEINKKVDALVEKKMKEALGDDAIGKAIHKNLYLNEPVVSASMGKSGMARVFAECRGALRKFGTYNFQLGDGIVHHKETFGMSLSSIDGNFNQVDTPEWKKYTEAVTYDGAAATSAAANIAGQRVYADGRPFVDPNGLQSSSIRDLVRFQTVADGNTEVVFQNIDAQPGRALTEGSANPNQTDNFISVSLNSFPTFGATQNFLKQVFENSYTGTLESVAQIAGIGSVHREAELCFRDITNAVSAPTNWFNGNGDRITADNNTTDVGTLSVEAIGKAQTALRQRGYPEGSYEYCLAVTPRQLNDLRNDPDIDRWMSNSMDGQRITSGNVPVIYGVKIVPVLAMGSVNTGNNEKERAVMFLRNYSIVMGSKREIDISLLQNVNRISVDWAWSKRVAAAIFKEQSMVRISTDGRA